MSSASHRPYPLIVSLTTLPSRIGLLRPTLDSLIQQTCPPDQILLCLPNRSRREGMNYERPDWLADYEPELLTVSCGDDYGPGTKLLGALDYLPDPSCLVIADDDMRYHPTFLENLYFHQARERSSSFSYYTYRWWTLKVGQGADGFSFHTPNLRGVRSFAAKALACPQLFLVDDLWISGFLYRHGIRVRSLRHLLPKRRLIYEATHSINQLSRLKGRQGRIASMTVGLGFMMVHGLLDRR